MMVRSSRSWLAQVMQIPTARQRRNQARRAERRSALGRAPLAPTERAKPSGRRKRIATSVAGGENVRRISNFEFPVSNFDFRISLFAFRFSIIGSSRRRGIVQLALLALLFCACFSQGWAAQPIRRERDAPATAGETPALPPAEGSVYVVLWFDTEDYILPRVMTRPSAWRRFSPVRAFAPLLK